MRTLVVGGGAASVPLAARLSEDPDREVVLIEAGAAAIPPPAELLDGSAIPAAVPGHPASWGYEAELLPGRFAVVPRGRLLGGSSAINGGYFVRATPGDFGRWAREGGRAWAHDSALPILAALENDLDFGDAPGHGSKGPMRVRRPDPASGLVDAFYEAARELGFPAEPDKNAVGAALGVGPVPSNIVDGVRINTAAAYLGEAERRPNLTVLGETRALRIRIENARATGVEVLTARPDGGGEAGFIAADEVVLCAGAVATPQLLLLSGVGPRAQLDALGISVIADLPVGERFHDHPNLALLWRSARSTRIPEERTAFPAALNLDSSGAAGLHPDGDLEILLTARPEHALFVSGPAADADPTRDTELRLIVALQQPRSRGRLGLRSADPLDPPRIEYRYLEHAEDRDRLRIGVRTAAALLRSAAFAERFGGFVDLDDGGLGDDEALDAWIRARLGTAIHMCGTAPMGAVVDGAGRVQGVDGLRVADTSILPSAPHRGPANTAVFIGELIARRMLRGE
ncbi:mycofactocin system GMC family oxidoreductase MftG [Leucobacter sp. wl10]|uniref:mycofactocin dehydrogenase MftG n=1 Tax=Leucobacter sp. wl10 TaxID=2304677 RepID=UPI000E5AFD17|nr:mycofactocin system GMC family oxidoreductase MftG [Leucobacter sp. wl10]RGE19318.1 mycofactocin system GMC family oxidoreductase MftG [Leucobacter sp. wl10]